VGSIPPTAERSEFLAFGLLVCSLLTEVSTLCPVSGRPLVAARRDVDVDMEGARLSHPHSLRMGELTLKLNVRRQLAKVELMNLWQIQSLWQVGAFGGVNVESCCDR